MTVELSATCRPGRICRRHANSRSRDLKVSQEISVLLSGLIVRPSDVKRGGATAHESHARNDLAAILGSEDLRRSSSASLRSARSACHACDTQSGQTKHRSMPDFIANREAQHFRCQLGVDAFRPARRVARHGGTASGAATTAGSAQRAPPRPSVGRRPSFFMASSMALGVHGVDPRTEGLERDHLFGLEPAASPLCGRRPLRYGACSTSLSRPALRRFSASLPTPHGATTQRHTRTDQHYD